MKISDINKLTENDHFVIATRTDYKEFPNGNSTIVKVPVIDKETGEQAKDDKGKLRWAQCTIPSQHEIDCFKLLPFIIRFDGASRCTVTLNGVDLYGKSVGYGSIRYSCPMTAGVKGVTLPEKPTATRTSAKDTERIERMKALGLSDADIASVMGA